MELYFILNIIISLATIFVMNARQLDYRKALYFGVFALACWLLPLQMLSSLRDSNLFIPVISDLIPAIFIPELSYIRYLNISLFAWVVILVSSIGCIKFVYHYRQYIRQIKLLNQHSKTTEVQLLHGKNIHISDTNAINGAMVSGIFSPIIWIGNAIQNGEQREAVILHESTHIKNRDPLVLFILYFIECLMWWNPLALVVAGLAKQHIEFSCDEGCKKELGLDSYKKHLAKLVLLINENDTLPMSTHFSSTSENFNIIRIKRLSEFKLFSWIDYLKYTLASIIIFALLLLFIRSGQTGLDNFRINRLTPASPTTWNVTIEQMPIRSIGILGVLVGLEGSYIHSQILYKYYYLDIRDATVNEFMQEFSIKTIATAKIIDNVLYVMPDVLDENDLSWITAEDTTYFAPRPEGERPTWDKFQLRLQKLEETQKRKPPDQ